MKKIISLFLCVAMMLSVLPMAIFAEGNSGDIVLPSDCFHSSLSYTNNGDDHSVYCNDCESTLRTEAHNFVNGTCVCGATEGPVVPTDPALVFASKSLSLQSYIQFNFAARIKTVLNNYDSWYITVSRYDYMQGKTIEDTVEGAQYSSSLWIFPVNLYSYMLNDKVTVTLYGVKNGVTYQGETYTSSVADYVNDKIASQPEATKTMYANMLEYGAKAQIYMNYNPSSLATDNLGEYASYITTTLPAMEDISSNTSTGATGVTFSRWALGISDSVKLQCAVRQGTVTNKNNVYAIVTWTRQGETVTQRIEGEDFVASGKLFVVVVDGIMAIEGRTPITVTIYDKTTNAAVSESMTSSISSYVANSQSLANAAQVNVLNALLNYYDSATAVYGS